MLTHKSRIKKLFMLLPQRLYSEPFPLPGLYRLTRRQKSKILNTHDVIVTQGEVL